MKRTLQSLTLLASVVLALPTQAQPTLSEVAAFDVNRPTGIAVSDDDRVFVSLPYSGYSDDRHTASVVEVSANGTPTPFPDQAWNAKKGPVGERFFNIQSLTIDSADRLWLLDTGSPQRRGVVAGGAKLIEVNIAAARVVRTLPFSADVVSGKDYLNDLRIDPVDDFAYVTDSVRGGVIVMDLKTGEHRRVMTAMPHLDAEALVTPIVESISLGDDLGKPRFPATDGVALSLDRETLYVMYRPLAGSRSLLAVPTKLLKSPDATDAQINDAAMLVATAVIADGIEVGPDGLVYFTDLERNAISRLEMDGTIGLVASSPELSWPDAIGFAPDGSLYVTTPQFHRLGFFNGGQDVSRPPFKLFRIKP